MATGADGAEPETASASPGQRGCVGVRLPRADAAKPLPAPGADVTCGPQDSFPQLRSPQNSRSTRRHRSHGGCWPATARCTLPQAGHRCRDVRRWGPSVTAAFPHPQPLEAAPPPRCYLPQNRREDTAPTPAAAGSLGYEGGKQACIWGQGGQKAAAFLPRSHG